MKDLKLLETNKKKLIDYLASIYLVGTVPMLDENKKSKICWMRQDLKRSFEDGINALADIETEIMRHRSRVPSNR